MIDRRTVLRGGGASLFGALALTAVAGELSIAEAAARHPELAHREVGLLPDLSTVSEHLTPVVPKGLTGRERAQLALFDDMDFFVYSGQQWDRMAESHAQDIRVHYPDGTFTDGLDAHIEALKFQFLWAPDTRVRQHPIKIAKGDLTAVVGIAGGTFTQPLPLPDGTSIPPTGKAFQFSMVTVGRWNRRGTMDEEFLFLDQQSVNQQIGLA
ncbi:MAG: ester cyclase [Actinobacteria bacterium]|nr:ester cyclase [Actinomycetota bacterium]